MKIAVAGIGYVGRANAILLARHNEVVALDIDPEKVARLNDHEGLVREEKAEGYLLGSQLNLRATLDKEDAYGGADFIGSIPEESW